MTTPPHGPDQDPNQHRDQPSGFPPAPPPPESAGNPPSAPPPGQYGQPGQRWDQAPPLSPDETRHATPPRPVQVSFWIWIASAGLNLLSGLLILTQRDELLELARQQNTTGLTEEQLQSAVNLILGVTLFVLVVIGLLYALFAVKMRAGRNWARIVLTVLTVLNVLGLFQGAFGVVGLVGVLAAVVAAVLMYLRPANDYFNQAKQRRQVA